MASVILPIICLFAFQPNCWHLAKTPVIQLNFPVILQAPVVGFGKGEIVLAHLFPYALLYMCFKLRDKKSMPLARQKLYWALLLPLGTEYYNISWYWRPEFFQVQDICLNVLGSLYLCHILSSFHQYPTLSISTLLLTYLFPFINSPSDS